MKLMGGEQLKDKKDKKIRILFLADQLSAASGGTEQHISFLLSNLPTDLYDFTFVLIRDTGFFNPTLFPIKPIYLNLFSLSSLRSTRRAVKQLSDLIRKQEIEIIQTFFYDSELLAILASYFNRHVLQIATRRNMGHHHNLKTLWRTRLTNKFISGFLANSEAVRRHVSSSEWVPLEKVTVIPNPLPQKRITEGMDSRSHKETFGIKEDEQVVGIVATISWVKDHETFLRAARLILDRSPKTKFILVGRIVPGREILLDHHIKSLKLESSVILAGEHLDPIPLMRLFDVGVLSSKSEGLSNTLIEYGALGIATVATDVGGNTEIVLPGQTGFIVPPGSPESLAQAILQLLDDDELRRQFGTAAKQRVTEVFEEKRILNQYHLFYRDLIRRIPS